MKVTIGYQVFVWVNDLHQRQSRYDIALTRSRELGKPLLVVGGPNPSSSNCLLCRTLGVYTHGYGDCCADILKEACEGAPRVVVTDVRNMPFRDKEFGVAYCSHVLEIMPSAHECQLAIDELCRVADEVVITSRTKMSVGNWFSNDLKQWVYQRQDGSIFIESR